MYSILRITEALRITAALLRQLLRHWFGTVVYRRFFDMSLQAAATVVFLLLLLLLQVVSCYCSTAQGAGSAPARPA